ncbi:MULTISPECIES: class I SAM-dependent methyltransferase [Proteus]|jgi:SAM-dependent methyltransferase|uniref:Methylase of polypeptide chain release factors n=1 Tax=Proteus vulgaris TaxID=585 RepID=A0A379FA09_PROVU|nr:MULTISPECIES: class I SAM-dependent methyltransferase [Proteus]RNT24007.1 class I SAM-dependent methyltransferase [Proteus mirabilis]AYY82055.1 class I SAM-dependent methyltransferase [Proteus vulgaris]KGA57402.1 methyltransferase domain protein [Proteus vulgaris]MBG5970282.1 class I SAM-dependent methyltransferase [Proteus vulgaris]MBG5985700.1 class I SAM-dependent methyltransferase [Proteus vulgaris]
MNTIETTDFAELYKNHMVQAERTKKEPEHWDKRAEKMAESCANPNDPYLIKFRAMMDFSGAETLLDVGCGPGSISIHVADKFKKIIGIDYSTGMLTVARRRAKQAGINHAEFITCSWEDSWDELPRCDIAVASRSTLVMDLQAALLKLNRQANLRVYTTHTVSPTFVDQRIIRLLGREVPTLPTYIYAVNMLNQMGIHPKVDYIRSRNCQSNFNNLEQFIEGINFSVGPLSEDEITRLTNYYHESIEKSVSLISPTRDWAMVSWDVVPESELTL